LRCAHILVSVTTVRALPPPARSSSHCTVTVHVPVPLTAIWPQVVASLMVPMLDLSDASQFLRSACASALADATVAGSHTRPPVAYAATLARLARIDSRIDWVCITAWLLSSEL